MMPRAFVLAVVFPIIALIGSGLIAWRQANTATIWQLPIQGYDPRDILRGNFIVFQYLWPANATGSFKSTAYEDWRICLNGDSNSPTIRFFDVYDMSVIDCLSIGRQIDSHQGMTFNKSELPPRGVPRATGILYIPEDHGALLNRLLADTSHDRKVRLRVAQNGVVTPEDILIDGVPYRNFLK